MKLFKKDPTKVLEACESAKAKAEADLLEIQAALARATREWIEEPTLDLKQALDAVQHAFNEKKAFVAQCDLAIADAKREHAEALAAAEVARQDAAWKQLEDEICPEILAEAKKISAHLDEATRGLFKLCQLGNDATALAPKTDVPIHDSLLNNRRVIGYFRLHLRKTAGAGDTMSWAYTWFDNPLDIPDFHENIDSALQWLLKLSPKRLAQAAEERAAREKAAIKRAAAKENKTAHVEIPLLETGIEAAKRPKKPRISLSAPVAE